MDTLNQLIELVTTTVLAGAIGCLMLSWWLDIGE